MSITKSYTIDNQSGNPFEMNCTWNETQSAGNNGANHMNYPEDDTVLTIGEEKTSGDRATIFLKYRLEGVPSQGPPIGRKKAPPVKPGAQIHQAKIQFFASGVVTTGTVDIACLEADGKWDAKALGPGAVHDRIGNGEVQFLRSTIALDTKLEGGLTAFDGFSMALGGAAVGNTASGNPHEEGYILNGAYSDVVNGTIAHTKGIAQIIKITDAGSGFCDRIIPVLQRAGDPVGDGIACRVWRCLPVSPFTPLKLIAEGDNIPYSGITTTSPTSVVIPFRPSHLETDGVGKVTIVDDEYYLCEVFNDSNIHDSTTNYIISFFDLNTTGLDDTEIMYSSGIISGFSNGNYPMINDLPYLYSGNSGTTIHKAPHNSIITLSFPTTVNLGIVEFDVTQLVQEWIHSNSYKNLGNKVIGFVIESADHFAPDNEENFVKTASDLLGPQLRVTYTNPAVTVT